MVFRKARSAEKRGDEAEARRLLEEVLQSYPKNVTARRSLARLNDPGASGEAPSQAELRRLIEAHERGDHAETIRLGEILARRDPDNEIVHTLLGAAKLGLRDYIGAEGAFREAVRIEPLNAAHYNNLGIALHGQGRPTEAEKACVKAIKLDPGYTDAHFNLGIIHEDGGRIEEAVACCRTVLCLAPDHVSAHYKLGALYREARRWPEAIDAYVKLLAIAPDHAAGLHDLGKALMGIGHVERAIETFRLAIRADPANAGPHCDLGLALTAAGRLEEAAAAFARATESLPSHYGVWGRLLNLQAYLCDWSARHALSMLPIEADQSGIPFDALPFEDDPLRQLQRSQVYASRQFRPVQAPLIAPPRKTGGRIRIGYFSADFYDHATLHLMSGLLREHDRSKFEIRAYDFSPTGGDEGRRRIGDHVDAFVDIRRMTDRDAVDLIRSHDLDIAVDLKGYTKDCRAQIFAERVAPVQISYLGYPGSLGADFMDYLIADPVVVPAGDERYYSERIIRLPGSYQPNDDRRPIADLADDRASLGLPEDGFVFCCFNQGYKIGPREFDIWMWLLREVPGSVLWLLHCGETAEANLRKEATARGVDPARLVFAAKLPHAEHLTRHRHADLFLDTFAVNAHTTASDALWGGLPVLTLAGKQFAARVAASLVTAVGLPDLVASTEEDYARMAFELALSPERLAAIRARLAENRLSHPLFDTIRYARHIEAAFEAVHERRLQGLAPDHITIG